MGTPIVRPYRSEDRSGFGHVRAMTYRGGTPVGADDKILRDDSIGYVAELDGEIVGATTVLDMTATKGKSILRCAGLAAVAVLPEFRKSGVGSALMTDILRLAREDGFQLASLYPFSARYYRQFGYEICGKRIQYKVARASFPKITPSLKIRTIAATDFAQLEGCYRAFGEHYSGVNIRKPDQWWRTLGGDTPLALYVAGDPAEAYAIVRLEGDFWSDQEIKEFVWSTPEGYRSMLSLFGSLAMNKARVEWFEPSDSPFMIGLFDQDMAVSIDKQIMFRALDVSACLRSIKPVGSGSFALQVKDDQIPENGQIIRIDYDEMGVSVEPAAEAGLSMSIQSFTQAFMGEPSLSQLLDSGYVQVHKPEDLAGALSLLRPQPVYCADFF